MCAWRGNTDGKQSQKWPHKVLTGREGPFPRQGPGLLRALAVSNSAFALILALRPPKPGTAVSSCPKQGHLRAVLPQGCAPSRAVHTSRLCTWILSSEGPRSPGSRRGVHLGAAGAHTPAGRWPFSGTGFWKGGLDRDKEPEMVSKLIKQRKGELRKELFTIREKQYDPHLSKGRFYLCPMGTRSDRVSRQWWSGTLQPRVQPPRAGGSLGALQSCGWGPPREGRRCLRYSECLGFVCLLKFMRILSFAF